MTRFSSLPQTSWMIAVCLIIATVAGLWVLFKGGGKHFVLISGAFGGFLYSMLVAQGVLADYLPAAWEGKDVIVSGRVLDVPEPGDGVVRFLFNVEAARPQDEGLASADVRWHGKVRLSWYQETPQALHAGERWQLVIRSKRPNGFMNPGGFDYEQWLFSERITATGYVREKEDNRRLQASTVWAVDSWRESLQQRIAAALPEQRAGGLVQGLAVAYRGDVTDEQWEVLRRTGTIHLLAISGLHIAMVAGLGLLPVAGVWWLFPGLYSRIPVRLVGGVAGALLATGYALLAGMTLPTQRSLIMVLVLLAGLLQRQSVPFSLSYSLALLGVLWFDPLASLSMGFWLSFLSVGCLFLLIRRRYRPDRLAFIRLQLGLSLSMIPLMAVFFGSVSLVAPLANLLAIPWVTLGVVPLILLGMLCLPVSAALASACWWVAARLLDGLFVVLEWLADWPWAVLDVVAVPGWLTGLAVSGVLLWMLPAGFPGRWVGLLLVTPVFLWQPERPDQGAFRLTVLDVGQGLASVVQTAQHTLVFDTGPKSSASFDTGELVLLPWLRAEGIRQVDALMVSHADNDHSGGAKALLDALPVKTLWSGDATLFPARAVRLCQAGQEWDWDGVSFRILHPDPGFSNDKRNNLACVLKVDNGSHAALLTADIEQPAERWLVAQQTDLRAEVMLAPHHGSKTSSSDRFLDKVMPDMAIVSTGYLNRFHHPHPKVVARYQARGVTLLNTVETGALSLWFPAGAGGIRTEAWRPEQQRFWNRRE